MWGGFQIIHFDRSFHCKPSFWGTPIYAAPICHMHCSALRWNTTFKRRLSPMTGRSQRLLRCFARHIGSISTYFQMRQRNLYKNRVPPTLMLHHRLPMPSCFQSGLGVKPPMPGATGASDGPHLSDMVTIGETFLARYASMLRWRIQRHIWCDRNDPW